MADLAAVLVECRERLTESLADCCADDLAPDEADELLLEAIAVEQLGHAAVLALVRRAMVGEPWRRAGDRSARHHVARRCGVSVFRATQVLETAAQLDDLHEVATAVRSGALSSKVTQLAAATATLAPDRQADILQSARSEPWVAFKLACDRIRVAADTRSDAERHDAAQRARRCTARTTPDGMFELTWSDATTAGAALWALLQPFIDRRYQILRQERPADGDRPSAEAIVTDALLDMARAASAVPEGRERPGAPSPPASGAKAKVIVHIDYRAWLHGAVTGDERCEIEGLGPIPVAAVRDLPHLCGDGVPQHRAARDRSHRRVGRDASHHGHRAVSPLQAAPRPQDLSRLHAAHRSRRHHQHAASRAPPGRTTSRSPSQGPSPTPGAPRCLRRPLAVLHSDP